jgi:membrane protein DedA with SNARE-associated domain
MEILHDVIIWLVSVIEKFGYPGIVFGMFLESSCFPFPSEVIMIPAGYLAHQGKMNFWMVISMGIIGSWLGALFNYYLAMWLGRPLLLKWGKYFFITKENFEKGEKFFQNHGEIGTFTGRLIPVVRQYISLPAGIARMNLLHFLFFTGLGAGIWVTILAWIGYVAGQSEDLWKPYLHKATITALVAVVVLVVVYVIVHRRKKNRSTASN